MEFYWWKKKKSLLRNDLKEKEFTLKIKKRLIKGTEIFKEENKVPKSATTCKEQCSK